VNILISGGAGYIGSHIVEQLIQKKTNVVIIDKDEKADDSCSDDS
jgi:UDP-glucose 4-epimerase